MACGGSVIYGLCHVLMSLICEVDAIVEFPDYSFGQAIGSMVISGDEFWCNPIGL